MIYFWKIILGLTFLVVAYFLLRYLKRNKVKTYNDVKLVGACICSVMASLYLIFTSLRDLLF